MHVRRSLILLLITATLALGGCSRGGDHERMKRFTERWRLLYNSHDLPGFSELYAGEGAYMTPGMIYAARSRSELREALGALWRSHSDMRIEEIHSLISSGDRIAFAWKLEFTEPRTGAAEARLGATFLTLDEGRIVHQLTVTSR